MQGDLRTGAGRVLRVEQYVGVAVVLLGGVSALLVCGVFFLTLLQGGWRPGDGVGSSSALHHVYLQATTATFLGIVSCQIGTAWAARSDRATLRELGWLSNPLLLIGIAFELVFAAALVAVPGLNNSLGMAVPPVSALLVITTFPVLVWLADSWRHPRTPRRELGTSASSPTYRSVAVSVSRDGRQP